MTTVSSHSGAPTAHRTGAGRLATGILGAAAVAFGVFLLFNPYSAARTLALLVGIALVLGGLLEFAAGWDTEHRGNSFLLGTVLLLGGVLALAWPGVTLYGIALIAGLSLIAHGLVRIVLAAMARREVPGWGWLALLGALNVLIGVLALAWPKATVLVLSLTFGAQILVFGLLLLMVTFIPPMPTPAVPAR